ncbi:MAG: DUF4872 domain-containing protein [Candidatus Lokiarchaeota archaeon]|nr:DUF4872 domain-containing protein [Candidatus Lokiarchaeota archaeon]
MNRLVIKNFKHMAGSNCQLSSLRKVLAHYNINLSEPMILGLSSGLGFFYFYMKRMPFPMILGLSVKKTELFERILNRLGGSIKVTETSSINTAHNNLVNLLGKGQPAITFVDFAYCPFFFAEGVEIPNEKVGHFGGHTFVTYGINEEIDEANISDRFAKPFIISYEILKAARSSPYAPFAAKNKLVELIIPKKIKSIKDIIPEAIKSNITFMYNPPIKNMGLPGFQKWLNMLPTWGKDFNANDLLFGLVMNFIYLETGGTGGAMFRILYKKFLEEASEILHNEKLLNTSEQLTSVINQIKKIGEILLPDDLPNMKSLRESYLKANKIQENGNNDYQKQLKIIDTQIKKALNGAKDEVEDWKKKIPKLKSAIQNWYKLEFKVWETIKRSI